MFVQLIKAIFLGVLQGLTEFLPISSTGHLIISEHILGVSQEKFGLTFDAAVHLGTALAVFLFFKKRWLEILQSFWGTFTSQVETSRNKTDFVGDRKFNNFLTTLLFSPGRCKCQHNSLWFYLLIGTIPAAIIGLLLEKTIENIFRQPKIVALALFLGSVIIFLAEKFGRKTKELGKIDFLSSLAIGFSQSLALLPGISRSGITIATSMFFGFRRKSAAEFAFLLSGPIVLGAGGKKLFDVIFNFVNGEILISELYFFAIGIVFAAISGFLTIKFLLNYLNHHSMNIFVIYRILLVISVLVFLC